MSHWGGHDHAQGWEEDSLGKIYDQRVVVRLLHYLRPYKSRMLLALIGMFGYAATSYAQPFLVGQAIDNFIAEGDSRGLNLVGIAFLVLTIAAWAFQRIQLANTAWAGHRVLYTLRTEMFAHLQKLSIGFYDRNEVGRVMSRVQNDVAVLQDLITSGVLTILADVAGLALVVFFLLYQDVQLALITLAVVPALAVFMSLWQRRARSAFIYVRRAIAVVNANLQESVSGIRVIQSLSREEENLRRFDDINAGNLEANIQAGRLSAAVMPVVEVLTAAATGLVVVYGGMRVIDGAMGVGVLVAFALYVQRFFDPIRDLVMQYTSLQRAMAGGQRIFELLDTKPEIEDVQDAVDMSDIKGEIVFKDVSFGYLPGLQVLEHVSLQIPQGETVALVGPTGAGKSTIAALVCRFYDVIGGQVLIDGIDIRKIRRSSLARRMGVVLQDPFLFSGTVKQNILFGRPEAGDEDVQAAAKVVGAHEFISKLPQGYDTVLHERGQNLSIGQRQLIAFARAIIADPRILILDEATANVDSATEAVLQKAIRRLLAGRTALVIAHRLSTVRSADRILAVDGGRIVEEGRHEELLARSGLYARLYQMTYQFHDTNGHKAKESTAQCIN